MASSTGKKTYQKNGVSDSSLGSAYRQVVRDYEWFLGRSKFTTSKDAQMIRTWLKDIDGSKLEIAEARANFNSLTLKTLREEEQLYSSSFMQPLSHALQSRIISQESYDQWMEWIENSDMLADDKKKSLREYLPQYLEDRRKLAENREKMRSNKQLKNVTDKKLLSQIEILESDREWFTTLDFKQRKNLLNRIEAGLEVTEGGKEWKKIHSIAEKKLMDATKEPQPALHRDKVGLWLKRIFKELPAKGWSFKEISDFVTKSGTGTYKLDGMIKLWRDEAIHFWTIRQDPAFEGVKSEFVNTKRFLWMHYKDRLAYVQQMKLQRSRAMALRSQAWSLIQRAEKALDASGAQRWVNEYIFNGNHTLKELESIINGNVAERLDHKIHVVERFDKIKKQASSIRGMSIPEKAAFLKMKYPAQESLVKEIEQRLGGMANDRPQFLLIRHLMDSHQYDEALELISEARKKGLTESDEKELKSMERYIDTHQPELKKKVGAKEKLLDESSEVDQLIDSLPVDMQDMVAAIAGYGAMCMKMFGWGMYNRDWCRRNGYLTQQREEYAVRTGKQQALNKQRSRQRRGAVSETIEGETGEEEFIQLSRSAATNVCLNMSDTGAKQAMLRTLYHKQSDHRAWYWTNIILHHSGAIMSNDKQREEKNKIYRIGRLLRTMESKGQRYTYRGKSAELAEKVRSMGSLKTKGSEAALAA